MVAVLEIFPIFAKSVEVLAQGVGTGIAELGKGSADFWRSAGRSNEILAQGLSDRIAKKHERSTQP